MGGVAWTEEEDHLLKKCIEQYGEGKWHRIPLLAGLNRCRKSCRLRWLNYLRPNIKRGSFEKEEIDLIIKLHKLLGNRWSLIAGRLPGRTANDVKNYWNCHLSKRLSAQEAEEKQINRNNVEAIRSEPLNFATSPTRLIIPEVPSYQLPQEESTTSTPEVVQQVEDAKEHQVVLQKEDFSYLGLDQEHGYAGDLGMDFQFEEVKFAIDDESSISKWDWDDLIVDMDLWNESL
ncbi:hypothetical protein K2173_017582 [Erythroxylum novogranatense]|uniref:Uncharacterized protein n=1 Tax=Erythroxylum novogranatense TaxID=1862640 RepID=A0AAV8T7V4_9ROSI|nr:hypothetical protein K2173_017582 [Erythroxylum novogranatense]